MPRQTDFRFPRHLAFQSNFLKIHIWKMVSEREADAYPPFVKHVNVTFTLEDITTLELEDFSIQNVIDSLELRKMTRELPSFNMQCLQPPKPLPDLYEIILEPCCGLSGKPEDTLHSD